MATAEPNPKKYFSDAEEEQIIQAIQQAERNSSGEIKVHVEAHAGEDAFARAVDLFPELEMEKTQERNGVLFYIAMEDHKFAIVADEGINQVVPDDFWEEIKKVMRNHFKAGEIIQGICSGISRTGIQLKEHFPYQSDDENEISDEISRG